MRGISVPQLHYQQSPRPMFQLLGNDEYGAPVGLLCELPRLQYCCRLRGVCPLNLCFNETTILNLYSATEHTVGRDFKCISAKEKNVRYTFVPQIHTYSSIIKYLYLYRGILLLVLWMTLNWETFNKIMHIQHIYSGAYTLVFIYNNWRQHVAKNNTLKKVCYEITKWPQR